MEEVAVNPIIELPELTQDWEIDSQRAQQKCIRTKKKGAVTPQETEPDLPVSVQESLEALVDRGLPWGKGHQIQESWRKSS